MASKHIFEVVANSYDVKVKGCLANNGIFAKNNFKQSVANDDQRIRFSVVSGHDQIGVEKGS